MIRTTIAVLIGNSDDRLKQSEWAAYVSGLETIVAKFALQTFFSGASSSVSKFQNACIVISMDIDLVPRLEEDLIKLASKYRQYSVAVLQGTAELLHTDFKE